MIKVGILDPQGPLAYELTIRCNLYDTTFLRDCAEFKAVTDESVDLKEVVCYKSHCENQS